MKQYTCLIFVSILSLISQAKEAGYVFDRIAAELQRDDIYIFRKL